MSDERVVARVVGAEAVHLVFADAPYPGWTARVDGEPAPLVPANVLGKAVAVPSGRHRVELEFRSRSFRTGLAITGATGLALLVAGLRARLRRRSAESGAER